MDAHLGHRSAGSNAASRRDGSAPAALSSRVVARKNVLTGAFADLSRAQGKTPPMQPPNGTIPSYLNYTARECTRELFGLVCQSRAPNIDEWLPVVKLVELTAIEIDELSENLMLVAEHRQESAAEGEPKLVLSLHVAHRTPKKDAAKAEVKGDADGDTDNSICKDCLVLSGDDEVGCSASFESVLGIGSTGSRGYLFAEARKTAAAAITLNGGRVFYTLGFVGDLTSGLTASAHIPVHFQELRAARQVLQQQAGISPENSTGVKIAAETLLASLASPQQAMRVSWPSPNPFTTQREVCLNEAQHAALEKLDRNIELIHGPPATGKSTTIHALATECLLPDDSVVICAVQNRAIEALVVKFEATSTEFITIGRGIVGQAQNHTLEAQLDQKVEQGLHPDVAAARHDLDQALKDLEESKRVTNIHGIAFTQVVSTARVALKQVEFVAFQEIALQATALLCTTASVGMAVRDDRLIPFFERASTACMDEAGSAADRHVLSLIECCERIERLVLLGDTRQLPVFTTDRKSVV